MFGREHESAPGTLVVKVDVIVAVYNAESTIEETVQSVMDQQIPYHFLIDGPSSASDGKGVGPSESEKGGGAEQNESILQRHGCNSIHFDVCICCYNDASTDKSLEILESIDMVERGWRFPPGSMRKRLLIGTAPAGTTSRGAGYARNQAVKLRDKYENEKNGNNNNNNNNNNMVKQQGQERCEHHFLCILDSDDVMHSHRIAEQTYAMLSLDSEQQRQNTLMGCQFDRIPEDSTQHYTQWANSLSDERLYLEQFRECTLLQPTWFLSKQRFENLGGYLEAPETKIVNNNPPKKAKIVPASKEESTFGSERLDDGKDTFGNDLAGDKFYRLIHPTEILEPTKMPTTTTDAPTTLKKRKNNTTQPQEEKQTNAKNENINTLRLAEDSRFFYAHLHAGGKLHLHRTKKSSPLVSYRHRSGMSQSSNTPRKLLLRLRAKAWEDLIFYNKRSSSATNEDGTSSITNTTTNTNNIWMTNGFAIWGAGRDGKDFLKALSPAVASKVVCFVDVDEKKIENIKWYDNPALDGGRKIPILHFSVLAKNGIDSEQTTFGRIEKKCGEDTFDVVSKNHAKPMDHDKSGMLGSKTTTSKKKKKMSDSIDPEVLRQLPVVVCVAMYRTNGALESNVASVGRVEGKDLWHII